MTVQVKICGVTRMEDANAAVFAGADFVGFNFHAPSPRFVDLEAAKPLRDVIGAKAKVVGVFVNADRKFIEERLRELRLDLLQFHGDEQESALARWPVPVIRAVRVQPGNAIQIRHTRADYVLIDTYNPNLYGGTGVAQPLDDLRGLDLSRVFISGGLHPDNVADAAALGPYAVDTASGVESAPGVKDHSKLRSFVIHAKSSR